MSNLLDEQTRSELTVVVKYLKNIENILQTSSNSEQRARLQKELTRYEEQLQQLLPGVDLSRTKLDVVINQYDLNIDITVASAKPTPTGRMGNFLAAIPLKKASLHCTDKEVNFIHTVLELIERTYWHSISDTYCQLDFTHSNKRDSLRAKLDIAQKSLNSITNTIDDHATLSTTDSRDQLTHVKTRHTRALLMETGAFMQNMYGYLKELLDAIKYNSNIVRNLDAKIQLQPVHKQEAARIDGKSIREALNEFYQLCFEMLEYLAIPDLKVKK